MKYIILFPILTALIFFGCAEPTDPAENVEESKVLSKVHVYETVGIPYDLKVSDQFVFVAEDQAGFSIFNRETKQLESRKTEYAESAPYSNVRQVSYLDGYNSLLVYNRWGGRSAVDGWDISEPDQPVFVATYQGGDIGSARVIRTITEDDEIILGVAMSNSIFQYGTVNPPDDMFPYHFVYRSYPAYNNLSSFRITDDYVFFSASQRGMYVFDRNSRSFVVEINLTGDALDIAVKGDYAYIVAKQEGLLVVNIADPLNPEWVYSHETTGWAQSVATNDNYLAVGSGGGGAYLFDIGETPEKPKLLERVTSYHTDYVYFVEISNGKLFTAGRYQGITEFRIND